MRLFWLLVLSSASHSTGYDCETMPLTMELVGLLAKRTSLMGEVAAQKADFALVFDAAQELAVLKAAAAAVQSTAIPSAVAMVFAQLMADCAKQEQEAHIRAAVEAAEAADAETDQKEELERIETENRLDAERPQQIQELVRCFLRTPFEKREDECG